jgi:hypothetical protein
MRPVALDTTVRHWNGGDRGKIMSDDVSCWD